MRVHVINTGRLVGNETVMHGEGWSSLLRRRRPYEFPVYSYIVERPYAAPGALILHAAFVGSRQLVVGPTAATAALSAAVVGAPRCVDPERGLGTS